MKTPFVLALIIGLFAGCGTTPESVHRFSIATQIVVKDGTFLFLANNPSHRPAFEMAVRELEVIEAAPALDFALVVQVFSRLPLQEISNPTTRLLISDAGLLLTYYNVSVPLDKVESLRPVVVAIRKGLQDGLSMKGLVANRTRVTAKPAHIKKP